MREMDIRLPMPEVPCKECIESRSDVTPAGMIAVYCEHNRAGGVIVEGLWRTFSPLSEEEFSRFLLNVDGKIIAEAARRPSKKVVH